MTTGRKFGIAAGAIAGLVLLGNLLPDNGTSGATETGPTTTAGYQSDWLEPNTLAADALEAARNACQEDDPCWNCETMGNRVCGTTTTEAPTTTSAPVIDERALDLAWVLGDGGADADTLSRISDDFGAASDASDVVGAVAACRELGPAAQAFGDHAPDTATGREAKAAAVYVVKAADACVNLDFDTATGYLEQAGPHLNAVVASIQATIGG